METIRVNGLVRLAGILRREVARGLPPDGDTALRRFVAENLHQVEQLLRQHGASPRALPAPSRRAYEFLTALDWTGSGHGAQAAFRAAAATAPAAAAALSRVSLGRLGSYLESILARLAAAEGERQLSEVHRSIDAASRRIEQAIRRRGLSAEQFTAQSRAARGWLAFFAQRANVDAYVTARTTLSPVVDVPASDEYPTPVMIHFRPLQVMFRLRRVDSRTVLHLPTPMIAMDEHGFHALVQQIFRPHGAARQLLHAQVLGERCQAVQIELERLGGIVEQTRGVARDLEEAFARINGAYFAGAMSRPRLCWSGTFTGRKFGHYDAARDLVMISRTLDQQNVPPFVLDFVLYHELLHKKHGVRWCNGRRMVHTGDFVREERLFHRYSEAETVLQQLTR